MKNKAITTTQTAAIMAILTVGSKILGFVREMVLANYFGAGLVTDAYVMGQSIPNTLMAAIITAAGTSYMPILAGRFELGGEREANKFTSQLLNALFTITAAFFVLALIFSRPLVSVFAPGYSGEKAVLTIYYMRIAFISLFFHAGITIFEAYLQYRGVFNKQTVVGYLQNISIIVFIIVAAVTDFHLLIFGVVIGFGLRFIFDYLLVKKNGFCYSPDFHMSSTISEVIQLALPVFIGGYVSEINTFVDKMLASDLPEGSVSALNYGSTIINVILAFVVTILITLIYPRLNKAFAVGDMQSISKLSERGIVLLSLVAVPCALGAMLYSRDIIYIIYMRGAFTEAAAAMASVALLFYAIRIPFYAINQLIIKVFYSLHDMKTPVLCSVVSLAVNVGLNLILVKRIGLAGLAIATSFAEMVNVTLQYFAFRRKHVDIVLLKSKRKLLLIVVFSVVAVGVSYLVYLALGLAGFVAGGSWISMLVRFGLSALVAVLAYLALLYAGKFEELSLIKDLVKRG